MSPLAPPLHPPHEEHPHALQGPRERPLERTRGKWGMWLFIGTEAMLFAMLFFAYAYLGSSRPEWPPESDPSLTYPLVLLAILLTSSVVLHVGEKGIKKGEDLTLRLGLIGTLLLAGAFIGVQRFEFVHHLKQVTPGTNAYGSILFTIHGFHLAHLILGMLMLLHVLARGFAGHFSEEKHLAVENVSLYWHFVDVVWVFIVGILYVSPHLYD
jgi:heme/copper-type cytochrome/quinol oxidase subunit 3